MFRRFGLIFICFLTVMFASAGAKADAINEEGAQKLKAMFEQYLDGQKAVAEKNPGFGFKRDGAVVVEPSGKYYAVTLPQTSITYPNGRHFDVGLISLNATPHDTPGQWKMTVALPTPMVMFDSGGNQVMRINLGGQRIAGLWDENLRNFAKLDAAFTGVVVESAAPQYTLNIPDIQTRHDFEKNANGTWSGPAFVTLAGLNSSDSAGNHKTSLGESKIRLDLDQFDPRKPAPTLPELLLQTSEGISAQASINNLHIKRPGRETNLQSGALTLSLKDLSTGPATMTARIAYNGFAVNPPLPGYEGLQPGAANIDVSVRNFPVGSIKDLLLSPPATGNIGLAAKIPAILAQSGTVITIKDSTVTAESYKIKLDGKATGDISAAFQATADAHMAFYGLHTVLARTQAQDAKNMRDISLWLEILKNVGKAEVTPDGQSVHNFNLVLSPQGQVLINDQDVMAIMLAQALKNGVNGSTPPSE